MSYYWLTCIKILDADFLVPNKLQGERCDCVSEAFEYCKACHPNALNSSIADGAKDNRAFLTANTNRKSAKEAMVVNALLMTQTQ